LTFPNCPPSTNAEVRKPLVEVADRCHSLELRQGTLNSRRLSDDSCEGAGEGEEGSETTGAVTGERSTRLNCFPAVARLAHFILDRSALTRDTITIIPFL